MPRREAKEKKRKKLLLPRLLLKAQKVVRVLKLKLQPLRATFP